MRTCHGADSPDSPTTPSVPAAAHILSTTPVATLLPESPSPIPGPSRAASPYSPEADSVAIQLLPIDSPATCYESKHPLHHPAALLPPLLPEPAVPDSSSKSISPPADSPRVLHPSGCRHSYKKRSLAHPRPSPAPSVRWERHQRKP